MVRQRWTRRSFLTSLAASTAFCAVPRARIFPSERVRYQDPATDFPVLRLTSPEHTSALPAEWQRAVSKRRSFLLYSNDRTGSMQLCQMTLQTGESRQLSNARDLDWSTPTLTPDERSVLFFDGPSLRWMTLSTLGEREVYRVPQGWRRGEGFSLAPDGTEAVFPETDGQRWRLRVVPLGSKRGLLPDAAGFAEGVARPLVRPKRAGVLFRGTDGGVCVSELDGNGRHALPLAPGSCAGAYWAGDGESVVYLNVPAERGKLHAIRECVVESGAERLIGATTQFATFTPNSDASVFVGASASKASPYVLLLFRAAHRELAVCEHRARDPVRVAPVFSPDSQRVYFVSDRHGKPAIYTVALDRLVEKTGE